MKKLGLRIALLLLLVGMSLNAQELKLAHIFSDHAVLQRETTTPVWGWGEPGKTVYVSNNWNFQTMKTTVAENGTWSVVVSTGKAGGSYTLFVNSGKDKVIVHDIAFGEVWICSGQSNMEMPVRGYGFQGVEGATDAILAAGETARDIRLLDIKAEKNATPQKDIEAVWELTTPEVAAKASAVGYFFAKRLSKSLGVPVGIIVNAWGGSRIEPWMTREAIDGAGLTQEELRDLYAVEEKPDHWPETPELIWNSRVAPIVGFAAKGILWYQGCSNMGRPTCYDKLQNAMVRFWREQWGRELPFIYTLLAPYSHGDVDGRWLPLFVENQMKTAEAIPSAWYVCTETLGDRDTIHPAKKKEVADLMVMRAMHDIYGQDLGIDIEYPRIQSVTYDDDGTVKLRLTHVWSNLGSISSRSIIGFELAGEDRVFHLAEAQVDWDGDTLLVRCPDVPKPVAVRYGWRNWMGANLAKTSGIPVPPFRTDDWEY
ncbi:MAG: sialate O-acetylesterase [Bacteroidales bacterium]|nr:sialate O-acetylesterase [Bacteroidales bacterium]MBR4740873.1 sialate O-acetylesterase [Bacteroidales bacterium]